MELRESNRTVLWRECTCIIPLKYNITGTSQYTLDCSGNHEDYIDSYPLSTAESWDQGLSAGIWYSRTEFPQTYAWKMAAAMGKVTAQFCSSGCP